jgi:predicted ATP-binding protein involved in virulence
VKTWIAKLFARLSREKELLRLRQDREYLLRQMKHVQEWIPSTPMYDDLRTSVAQTIWVVEGK